MGSIYVYIDFLGTDAVLNQEHAEFYNNSNLEAKEKTFDKTEPKSDIEVINTQSLQKSKLNKISSYEENSNDKYLINDFIKELGLDEILQKDYKNKLSNF